MGECSPPLCVQCDVSGVMCISFHKVVELVGGGSVINGAYPSSLLLILIRPRRRAGTSPGRTS